MSWFRVDDKFPHHPKLERLRKACKTDLQFATAVTVWCLMGADCMGRGHGGVFSELRLRQVVLVDTKTAVLACEALATAELIHVTDGGWVFHDFEDYNPSAEEMKERAKQISDARREAGRRGGSKSGEARSKQNEANAKQTDRSKTKQTDEANGQASEDLASPLLEAKPEQRSHVRTQPRAGAGAAAGWEGKGGESVGSEEDAPVPEPDIDTWDIQSRIRAGCDAIESTVTGEKERSLLRFARNFGPSRFSRQIDNLIETASDPAGLEYLRAQYSGPLALSAMLGSLKHGAPSGDGLLMCLRLGTEWVERSRPRRADPLPSPDPVDALPPAEAAAQLRSIRGSLGAPRG